MAYKPTVGAQMAAPNVIPMADIMLVLLIIFMVVTPMLQKGVSVDMAKADNPRDMQDADKDDAVDRGGHSRRQILSSAIPPSPKKTSADKSRIASPTVWIRRST